MPQPCFRLGRAIFCLCSCGPALSKAEAHHFCSSLELGRTSLKQRWGMGAHASWMCARGAPCVARAPATGAHCFCFSFATSQPCLGLGCTVIEAGAYHCCVCSLSGFATPQLCLRLRCASPIFAFCSDCQLKMRLRTRDLGISVLVRPSTKKCVRE